MTKVNYLREFKTIDTQEKAYILGLWYADGFTSNKNNKYFASLTLHLKDLYILEEINKLFPFFYIDFDKSKPTTRQLRCNQKEFIQDMILNGCLPSKSFENKSNLKFPKLNLDFIPHFIRGFFDGDGSVYFSKSSSINSKYCTFVGNTEIFMRQLRYILYKNNMVFKLTLRLPDGKEHLIRGKSIVAKQECYILTCSNRETIDKFGKFLYTDSLIHFKRKYDIINLWYNTLSERALCQICNSSDTVYHGKNYIHCKSCNKKVPLIGTPFTSMQKKQCKHCVSENTVGNGVTRSRTDGRIISQIFLCRDCNKNSSYKIETAPL